jgi:hypothetical protein
MGAFSRIRAVAGGRRTGVNVNLTDGRTQWYIPDDLALAYITGDANNITNVYAATYTPGRTLTIVSVDDTSPTFINNSDTTTPGQMDLGVGNITLEQDDVLVLLLRPNMTWVRILSTDN